MGARITEGWRLALALLLPSLGGLAYLAAFGAPTRLIAVNAAALVAALAWVLWGRVPAGDRGRLALALAAASLMFVPLLTGPELGGVSRWLPLGPVSLHSGALLLPLILVIAASAPRFGPVLLALAAAGLAIQPDAGSLAGLAAASAVLAASRRDQGYGLLAGLAAVHAVLTFGKGALAPQPYTEGVLAQVWQGAPLAALALAALLFLAPAWLLVRPARDAHGTGPALAALLIGFGAMAAIAPFPFPLIGYGAAPILGFGLALGAMRSLPRHRTSG